MHAFSRAALPEMPGNAANALPAARPVRTWAANLDVVLEFPKPRLLAVSL